jgi:hypothetical protein
MNKEIRTAILDDIKDKLDDANNYVVNKEASELHHHLCNEDYFIIGTYKAKQFLGDSAFEAIEYIKEYELDNFGTVSTKLDDPERVVNMLAYIIGEEILRTSDHLNDKWNSRLDFEDAEIISNELEI